jgi:hypothetical protein
MHGTSGWIGWPPAADGRGRRPSCRHCWTPFDTACCSGWVQNTLWGARMAQEQAHVARPVAGCLVLLLLSPLGCCSAAANTEEEGGAPSCTPYDPGPPVARLVPPGQCVIGYEEWTPAPLLKRKRVSHDTVLLTFGLQDASRPLGLSTCACLLAQGAGVIRPYTPVSTNALLGKFELMVKVYENDGLGSGVLSRHLATMSLGYSVVFKHIPLNVKFQYPFGRKHIAMIAGGTGITPMLQALHAALGTHGDDSKISLIVSNREQKVHRLPPPFCCRVHVANGRLCGMTYSRICAGFASAPPTLEVRTSWLARRWQAGKWSTAHA